MSPCSEIADTLRNAYITEVIRVKEDYSSEKIPIKLRSDLRQDK